MSNVGCSDNVNICCCNSSRSSMRKNKKYIDFIKEQPCIFCAKPAEPHHVRNLKHIPYEYSGGTGLKPSDFMCVPLCHEHHRLIHAKGCETINWSNEIIKCLVKYICSLEA